MTTLDRAYERLFVWAIDHATDGWPTPADVVRFARRCRVPAHDLGREFGLFSVRRGAQVVWVDAIRDPDMIGPGLRDGGDPGATMKFQYSWQLDN